jgi:hypothetical protein
VDLHYAEGIAAARTTLALHANPAALQRRLPSGWELAPYAGDDLRGTALRGANLLVPCHEVYATRTHTGQPAEGLAQLSYLAFVAQARHQATGTLGHLHWWTYTEDPTGVPGKYRDATWPTAPARRPAPSSSAARPRSMSAARRWPTADRSGCRWPTGRAAWWSGRPPRSPICPVRRQGPAGGALVPGGPGAGRGPQRPPGRQQRVRGRPAGAGRAGRRVRRHPAGGGRVPPTALPAARL